MLGVRLPVGVGRLLPGLAGLPLGLDPSHEPSLRRAMPSEPGRTRGLSESPDRLLRLAACGAALVARDLAAVAGLERDARLAPRAALERLLAPDRVLEAARFAPCVRVARLLDAPERLPAF